MVNDRLPVFIYFHSLNGAGTDTWAHNLTDGIKRTDLFTASTLNAQFLIDV